jgi:chromosome condensin MukBEF ATPase and DNA-binding subunit MukB
MCLDLFFLIRTYSLIPSSLLLFFPLPIIPPTVDLEQQAGLLASEKQYNDQLQDELRELAGDRERLRQDLDARERQMREYERALAEAQAAEEERRNEDRQRQESFQVREGREEEDWEG